MIYLQDADFTLHQGDALEVLRELPSESVDCVITSPPYWGLRDYGTGTWEGGDAECDHEAPPTGGPNPERYTAGGSEMFRQANDKHYRDTCGRCGATRIDSQLGLEPTPEEYVARMVEVFREVRRVLAKHGTCWVNMGDSYATGGSGATDNTKHKGEAWHGEGYDEPFRAGRSYLGQPSPKTAVGGLKPKDLCGIPWRLAFALQADGWCLRSDVIWAKPNPMPESVTDRPTKAHEMVFLLSKCKWVGPERGQFSHISDEDARWLALLFDTEGNIVIKRAEREARTQYGAQMAFANTSRSLLERAQAIVGSGSIHERAGKNAPVFYWQLGNRQARDLLYRIAPYLIVKQRQARVAIHMHDVITEPKKRPGGYRTPDHEAFLEKCWQTVKELNKFGTPDLSWVPELRYGRWLPERYFFDQEAVREPWGDHGRDDMRTKGVRTGLGYLQQDPIASNSAKGPDGRRKTTVQGQDGSIQHRDGERWPNSGRNIRSVWEIATQPFPEAHFATFPEELVRRCLLAGCPEQVCGECGKARERITRTEIDDSRPPARRSINLPEVTKAGHGTNARGSSTWGHWTRTVDEGFFDCGCGQHDHYREWPYRPGIVLDPFCGSGTVALVARKHGRRCVGIELNPEYCEMIERRTQQLSLLADEGATIAP